MSWPTAITDVRTLLSDGPTDKLRHRKKLIGEQNGTSLTFKTFEFRRVTDFTVTAPVVGVFLDNAAQTVASDDLTSGEFVLSGTPPTDGQSLVASYYIQWFTDAEIDQFLVMAAEWIGEADVYDNIGQDFRPAAKEYAASMAYQKLIAKFAEQLAETYQLNDAPDEKRFNPITAYAKISKDKYDRALALRDDVYTRKGMAKAPRSATLRGTVGNVTPNR